LDNAREAAEQSIVLDFNAAGEPSTIKPHFAAADPGPAGNREFSPAAKQRLPPRPPAPPVGIVAGSVFGLIAALFYTGSNIALRQSVGVDPFLVTAMKAYPMVAMLVPYVLWMQTSGRTVLTSPKMLPRFIAVSFVAHFIGNSCFQFSLGIIGLAATVPITLGVLIVGGAVLGRVILAEPVRPRTLVSMVTIIAAVVILSLPHPSDSPAAVPVQALSSTSPAWIGALWACGAGLSYSLFGVITRQTLNGGLSAPATMLISGLVGVCTLTPFTILRLGWGPISEVAFEQWVVMLAAGVFNFTAFIALTYSLKALPVVAVNLLNASQVAMAAVAGVILFSEPLTATLIGGILLTFVGLLVMANRHTGRRT
jgi:drug/metabolite transporter (DMT)-like permease